MVPLVLMWSIDLVFGSKTNEHMVAKCQTFMCNYDCIFSYIHEVVKTLLQIVTNFEVPPF